MKFFLLLVLAGCPVALRAQNAPLTLYTDPQARYELSLPAGWQLRTNADEGQAIFAPDSTSSPVVVTLVAQPLPESRKKLKLTIHGWQDSLWRRIRRLPNAQVRYLSQQDYGTYDELRYDYSYTSAPNAGRTHLVGRKVWRGGSEYRIEYRAPTAQDGRYLSQGRLVVESFAFAGMAPADGRPSAEQCDNKMYGIAAYRFADGQWQDDCRTIHEFSLADPTARPRAHRRVLPFQSYALAKGFDNCLYAVPSAPTDTPVYVYRYNPATRRGGYTTWQLPAQGPETGWISASTDEAGNLYFLTGDANRLVRVSPGTGSVKLLWKADPTQQAPYYPAISFPHAGTHGNFCLDDAHTLYMVYSTDGALLRVDMSTRRAHPDLLPLDGLPQRGGYSDVLLQNDRQGRRRIYLAGPKAIYQLDPNQPKARILRRGTYTDLAGCNLFRREPNVVPTPLPPTTASWRGRVLDAATSLPLPQAQLRVGPAGSEQAVPLTSQAAFAYPAQPGQAYAYHAQLTGYLATDSTWMAAPGPLVRDILLQPLTVGTTLPLTNVQFEQGRAVLLPGSTTALDRLVRLMTDNPQLTIELRGHTDNVGPPEKNVLLSEQRVGAVKAYLVGHGIAEGRITGLGLGGTQPIASNEQEATRKLNRRVEFQVTGVR
jgi:outer membrane protein OmpA-like peptidoglycan-associated protein